VLIHISSKQFTRLCTCSISKFIALPLAAGGEIPGIKKPAFEKAGYQGIVFV
jgi:hypothetical protein